MCDAALERLRSFEILFCGSVLIRLRDQFLALERIASVCRGRFVSAEEYDRLTSPLPIALNRWRGDDPAAVVFWHPNLRAWRRMLWSAGFERVERVGRFTLEGTDGLKVPHVVHHAFK